MSKTVEKIVAGNMRAVSRLIRDIDDEIPEARETLKELYPNTGRAFVIGITGPPGVGKSTLVDKMIERLREQEKTVGVLAVDPSSPFHGGAILGDRIRMQKHITDEGVFIRSMATRGAFGGLTESTRGAIEVLDAMGKDVILVETVGVGQDEVDIVRSAHTTIVVLMPGTGDEIQAIKAGILEIGDIFVINKARLPGADSTANSIRMMLSMGRNQFIDDAWTPTIVKVEAIDNEGIVELLSEIEKHQAFSAQRSMGRGKRVAKDRMRDRLGNLVRTRIIHQVLEPLIESDAFEDALTSICEAGVDPYSACDGLGLDQSPKARSK